MVEAIYPAIFKLSVALGEKYSNFKNHGKKEKILPVGALVMKEVDKQNSKKEQCWEGLYKVVGFNKEKKDYYLIDNRGALLDGEVP